MVDNYFVPGTVIQGGYPIEMRYGGPREALLHALIGANDEATARSSIVVAAQPCSPAWTFAASMI